MFGNSSIFTSRSIILDIIAPTKPVLTYNNVTDTSVDITGTSTDNIGVVSFDIYIDSVLYINIPGASFTNYTLTGLTSGENYDLFIVAKDLAGNASAPSDIENFTTTTSLATPVLTSFYTSNSQPSRLYFTASSSVAGLTIQGFRINDRTISSVTLDVGNLSGYFTVAAPFKYGEIIWIECLGGNGTIEDFYKDYVLNSIVFSGTQKWVTPTGAGNLSGDSEANAYNLTSLNSASITAGTRVNIKKGSYTGSINIRTGNSSAFTIYEGYSSQPGDLNYDVFHNIYGQALSATNMPLFTGNNVSGEYWADLNSTVNYPDYVAFKNLQITNYNQGIRATYTTSSKYLHIDNCAFVGMGSATLTTGMGIYLDSKSTNVDPVVMHAVVNSYFSNNSGENCWVNGNDAFLYNCKSYSDITSSVADTDYMFVSYQGNNMVWRNLYAEKVGNTHHDGHGFALKSNEEADETFGIFNSTIINCSIKNVTNAIQFRHHKVKFNKAIGCTVDGSGGNSTGAIHFRDGASFNTVDRCYIKDWTSTSSGGVTYADTSEDGGYGQMVEGNIVQNCIFKNGPQFGPLIMFGDSAFTIKDNKILNCTFYNVYDGYRTYSSNTVVGTEVSGCIYYGFTREYYPGGFTETIDSNNNNYYNFWGVNGTAPTGFGNTSFNPNFVDFINFIPQTKMSFAQLDEVSKDYAGNKRSTSTTKGAIEINQVSTTLHLSNFRINANYTSRVYFDSNIDIDGLTTTGFVISGKTISSVTKVSNGGYFTVSDPFTYWDNNTIRLGENNSTTNVNSMVNNFTLTYIINYIPEPAASTIRYAAATTQGTGSGLDATNAWSYSTAFSSATAGMTVWMKAGTVTTNLTISVSGTVSSPIKFIGYKTTPGDIQYNYYTPIGTDNFSTAEMPTIDRNNVTTTSIKGLECYNQSYIVLENFQVTRAGAGVQFRGGVGHKLKNINVKTIGDDYNEGIMYYGVWSDASETVHNPSKAKILNCHVKDVTGNGIETNAAFVLVKDCVAYCSTACVGDGTDYLITGAGWNNIYTNNHVERQSGVAHESYYGFKSSDQTLTAFKWSSNVYTCKYNLVEKSTVLRVGRPLKARNSGTEYNVFKDNLVIGEFASVGEGISIFGAAKYNIWERNYIQDQYSFMQFWVNQEDNYDSNKICNGNIVRNNIFKNARFWITAYGNDFGGTAQTIAYNNTKVYNNTFYGMQTVANGGAFNFLYYEPSTFTMSGNELKNNIFYDVNRMDYPSNSQVFANGWSFLNNDYYAWDVALPTDTGAITTNPNFKDTSSFIPQAELYIPRLDLVYTDFTNGKRHTQTTVGAVKHDNEIIPEIQLNTFEGFGSSWAFTNDYEVKIVTNLNASGAGSLKEAVESSTTHAGKIIVFNGLSGTITATSAIKTPQNQQIYIAGQTSQNGILIKGDSALEAPLLNVVGINGLIVRGITFAVGATGTANVDGDNVAINDARNVIFDHCSFLWSTDENLDMWSYPITGSAFGGTVENVTIQNCIIAEGLMFATHQYTFDNPAVPHSMGSITGNGTDRITFYNNVFACNNQRNPLFNSSAGGNTFEMVNNILWNHGNFGLDVAENSNINLINNIAGKDNGINTTRYDILLETTGSSAYVLGNINTKRTSSSQAEWSAIGGAALTTNAPSGQQSLTPFETPLKNTTTISPSTLRNNLTRVGGVGTFKRNSAETRILSYVAAQVGGVLIDNPTSVGGYPTIAAGTIIADSDNDGIPDSLEGTWGNNTLGYIGYLAGDAPLDNIPSKPIITNIVIT